MTKNIKVKYTIDLYKLPLKSSKKWDQKTRSVKTKVKTIKLKNNNIKVLDNFFNKFWEDQ